jgi:hypothetical protein
MKKITVPAEVIRNEFLWLIQQCRPRVKPPKAVSRPRTARKAKSKGRAKA